MYFVSDHRSRGVSSHPAGVWPRVGIAYALVILAGRHRQNVLAVNHHDKARFFAVEELFNHDAVARVAKGVTRQHILHGGFRFFEGHRHDNAFPGSQAVGFDHDGRAFFTQVSQSRLYLGEVLIFRRRDVMTREKIFGEGF